jgi:hypothetical protein
MNTKKETTAKNSRVFLGIMGGIGGAAGIWAIAAFFSALSSVNFHAGELLRQYMVAVGLIHDYETLVDFYTHIKGVEYVICLAFLGAFPAFFKYVNKPRVEIAS